MTSKPPRRAARTTTALFTAAYVVFGALWFLFFTQAAGPVGLLLPDSHDPHAFEGLLFVGVTGALFYGLSGRLNFFARAEQLERFREEAVARVHTLATAIEQSHDLITITDPQGIIEYVNASFEKVTGYKRENVIGSPVKLLKSGAHEQSFYQEMWRTLLRGEVWYARVTNRRRDGSRYIEEKTITPVRDENGRTIHYISLGRDATEGEQLRTQLQAAQRLEAVARLAGGVAHDFNNLLTVILGRTHLLLQRLQDNEAAMEGLEVIHETGRRAAALTRQLLDFSRKRSEHLERADVNALVRELGKMIRPLIGADIRFETVLSDNIPAAGIDPTELEQILMNLVVNARDAMPEGGVLSVETAPVQESNALPEPLRKTGGPFVRLRVRDTGMGMNEETRRRLFEPFYTTKEIGKGTGLGLSTLHQIVSKAGGAVDVESAPGNGATFDVYLPAAQTPTEPAADSTARHLAETAYPTVLFVDDEATVRELAAEVLQAAGYRVLQASNAEQALGLFQRIGGGIDLLVSDVAMPGAGGPELAEAVRQRRPDIRVLFVSGSPSFPAGNPNNLPEGAAFLSKPFSVDALEKKVQELLGAAKVRRP